MNVKLGNEKDFLLYLDLLSRQSKYWRDTILQDAIERCMM